MDVIPSYSIRYRYKISSPRRCPVHQEQYEYIIYSRVPTAFLPEITNVASWKIYHLCLHVPIDLDILYVKSCSAQKCTVSQTHSLAIKPSEIATRVTNQHVLNRELLKREGHHCSLPGGRDCLSLSALSPSATHRVYRYFLQRTLNLVTSPVFLILTAAQVQQEEPQSQPQLRSQHI